MGDLADLLRPRDLLAGPDQHPLVMAAEVLDTAPLRVKVPEFDGGRNALSAFGPAGGLVEGDEVRVMLDAHGQFVVIAVENAPAGGAPSGPAGGVLSGTYPDPGFAADMATQAELGDEQAAREAADTDLAGDLATESGARAAADTNEATIRAAADTDLDGRLDALESVAIPLVTSLPGSPPTGQVINYQTAAMAALSPPVVWQLMYDGTKWCYLGGPPLFAEVTADQGTSVGTYTALATAGPSIALPVAGDYDVAIGCRAYHATAGGAAYMSYDIGGTGAVDADATITHLPSVSLYGTLMRERRKTGLTAVTLTAKYKGSGATQKNFEARWMRVTPVRLG